MPHKLSPVTQQLIDSILCQDELTPRVLTEFGIQTPRHFAALCDLILTQKIEPHALNDLACNGPALTRLIEQHYPDRDLTFTTPLDGIGRAERGKSQPGKQMRHERELAD
jgi:hypothetical protein